MYQAGTFALQKGDRGSLKTLFVILAGMKAQERKFNWEPVIQGLGYRRLAVLYKLAERMDLGTKSERRRL